MYRLRMEMYRSWFHLGVYVGIGSGHSAEGVPLARKVLTSCELVKSYIRDKLGDGN